MKQELDLDNLIAELAYSWSIATGATAAEKPSKDSTTDKLV